MSPNQSIALALQAEWWDYCIKSLKDAGLPKGSGAAAYKNAFQAAVVGLVKPFLTVETSLMTESEWDNDN